MAQLSFGEQGDILFDDIYDTSFVDRKLVPYAPLIICCILSTKAAFKLILRRCSRRSLPPPPTCRWRSPPEPVADGGAVVEKTVFGMLHETRQLWIKLLRGTHTTPPPSNSCRSASVDEVADQEAISDDEAQSFISNILQRCINLMDINNGRDLMTHALGCVDAWLQVL
jgi:hypothetical protein